MHYPCSERKPQIKEKGAYVALRFMINTKIAGADKRNESPEIKHIIRGSKKTYLEPSCIHESEERYRGVWNVSRDTRNNECWEISNWLLEEPA